VKNSSSLSALLDDKKVLFVASTGGHLAQLHRLSLTTAPHRQSSWVTFDTPQSRSLLEGELVTYIDYIPPRGLREILRGARTLARLLRQGQYDVVVSTGAGIALASHPIARIRNCEPIYIESVSRVEGPSTTGKILELLPGVRKYSQHEWGKSRRGWKSEFSVLDTFRPTSVDTSSRSGGNPIRVFVTLGTIHPYEFTELVRAADAELPPDAEIVWQVGATVAEPSRGVIRAQMSSTEFSDTVRWADLVVSHAGVGTLMNLVEQGKSVVAVPRRASRREHVDDHQTQIAQEFGARGLVNYVEVEDMSTAIHSFLRRWKVEV
jgi:UDP-N-acetylglucosamine--N-acetylmuramyl-(pentapeptide) pyrophosphoryl-undecaprenol N-acetylglucosamine transferase